MNERLNWMFPSLFLGRMFSTDVRISAWFGLIPFILCPRYGLELGLAVTLLFVVTALLHDFSHVIAARWTGGYAEEIHLTPLGGLVPTRSGQGAIGAMLTAAAGPGFNLLACLALLGARSATSDWSRRRSLAETTLVGWLASTSARSMPATQRVR